MNSNYYGPYISHSMSHRPKGCDLKRRRALNPNPTPLQSAGLGLGLIGTTLPTPSPPNPKPKAIPGDLITTGPTLTGVGCRQHRVHDILQLLQVLSSAKESPRPFISKGFFTVGSKDVGLHVKGFYFAFFARSMCCTSMHCTGTPTFGEWQVSQAY